MLATTLAVLRRALHARLSFCVVHLSTTASADLAFAGRRNRRNYKMFFLAEEILEKSKTRTVGRRLDSEGKMPRFHPEVPPAAGILPFLALRFSSRTLL